MQSVYEAAGSGAGVLRLAEASHRRVLADDVVSHAFSHGFNPQHSERLAAYWAEALDENPEVRQVLHDYFAWATTTPMSGYHDSASDVPADLRFRTGRGTGSRAQQATHLPARQSHDRTVRSYRVARPRTGRGRQPFAHEGARHLG